MSLQFISYDLRKPGQDYDGLYEAIKALGACWHCLESVWLVSMAWTSVQILNALSAHLDANDGLVVADLGGDWAMNGVSDKGAPWLRQQLAR